MPSPSPILNTRVLAVPRARVYQAFAERDQVARWWGPQGFTNTISEFDLRPGGPWRFVMHGPDGSRHDNAKQFLEVAPGERVVLRHLDPVHGFTLTMTFADAPGGTRLTWEMLFDRPDEHARLQDLVAAKNEENFDRLAAHLAASQPSPGP